MEERRMFPRSNVNCFIWYHKKDNDRTKVVLSRNISAIGIMFLSGEYIPIETKINVKIKMPNTESPIHLEGEVVRSQATTGMRFFKTAIKFDKPSEEIRKLITYQIKNIHN